MLWRALRNQTENWTNLLITSTTSCTPSWMEPALWPILRPTTPSLWWDMNFLQAVSSPPPQWWVQRQLWFTVTPLAGAPRVHWCHFWWVDETVFSIQCHFSGRDGSHRSQQGLQHGSLLPSNHQRGDLRNLGAAGILICCWTGWWASVKKNITNVENICGKICFCLKVIASAQYQPINLLLLLF